MSIMKKSLQTIATLRQYRSLGQVQRLRGLVLESVGPRARVGDLCTVESNGATRLAEVVGFSGNTTLLMALEDLNGLSPNAEVHSLGHPLSVALSPDLRGRVINSLGQPLDAQGDIFPSELRPLYAGAPHPLNRPRVTRPLSVGVRAIDGLLTIGEGQRVGIFSGSGVGKSVLLGMMARRTSADVVVIGLIGERGREVRDFIEKYLGAEGLKKSVVVVETSERWPLLRIKGVMTATTIAEYFRDRGLRVLLLVDSITRVCHAMREVGLSLGEPPATRGYPPSVFATLPKILERAGNAVTGSITAIYTVLVEGDDLTEPVSDTVRSILDGHIVLSRKLASQNHFPAVDVLKSVSRVMVDVSRADHLAAAAKVKEWLAAYYDAEDLISIGAYARGSRRIVDEAMERLPAITEFLKQGLDERTSFEDTVGGLRRIAGTS